MSQRLACRASVAAGLMVAAAAAWAAPATYVCEDRQVIKLTATPLYLQVEAGGKHWTAKRVRDAREAYYANGALGMKVFIRHSDMDLQGPFGHLHCKLLPQSMEAKNFYVAPSSVPAASAGAH